MKKLCCVNFSCHSVVQTEEKDLGKEMELLAERKRKKRIDLLRAKDPFAAPVPAKRSRKSIEGKEGGSSRPSIYITALQEDKMLTQVILALLNNLFVMFALSNYVMRCHFFL